MGFRDDREASQQRLDALERDLAAAKTALDGARLRAAESEDLRKRLEALGNENAALRRGLEPRQRRMLALSAVALVAVGAVGVVVHSHTRAELERARVGEELAVSAVQQCEAQVEPLRHERDAAREELAGIDEVERQEVGRLESLLASAQLHQVGAALLVTAHVTDREGAVPVGTDDDCVLAIRDIGLATCVATVVCGATRVYPFLEPAPTVTCTSGPGGWRADGRAPLDTATAVADPTLPPLLALDARARTLVVRETGTPSFTLRMRITDTLPYRLPSLDP